MPSPTTRRRFIQSSAAAAAGAATFSEGAFARRPDGPNVLVVVIDSLRYDFAYGDGARTPAIDALVREGLRFTHAYPEAMPTVPARNSLLSGRRMFPFRGWHDYKGLLFSPGWAPLSDTRNALPAVLRRAGYFTSFVTDNPFLGFSKPYAEFRGSLHRFRRVGGQIGGSRPLSSVPDHVLRHWLHPATHSDRSRQRVGQYLANSRSWEGEEKTYAGRVFTHAMSALDEAASRGPFALFVDTYEPHEPWTPPRRYLDLYGDEDWRGPEPAMPRYMRTSAWLAPGEQGRLLRRMRALYAAEVTMTDRWLGRLIDRLHELKLERETAIVLVSDHGILLGEHGWTGKISSALYPALTRVPLVVVDPARRRAGSSSDWFASTHDIAPTVLRMAGVAAPKAMTGADLSRPFRGRRLPSRPFAIGGYGDHFYIRSERWALWGNNRPGGLHLHDLRADPGEHTNLAAQLPDVVGDLYERVLRQAGGRLPYYGV